MENQSTWKSQKNFKKTEIIERHTIRGFKTY